MTIKRLILISVLLAFTCIATFAWMIWRDVKDLGPTVAPDISQKQIEFAQTITHLDLPTETQYLYFEYMMGLDDCLLLKIKLPSEKVDTIFQKISNEPIKWETGPNHFQRFSKHHDWQVNVDESSQFLNASFQLPNAEFMGVYVEDRDIESKTIFIVWHQT